jgi:hypothetical protein
LSLPLVAGRQGIVALNLYSRCAHGFTAADPAIGTELAAAASLVLANATSNWEALTLSEHLSAAKRSRAVMEQFRRRSGDGRARSGVTAVDAAPQAR